MRTRAVRVCTTKMRLRKPQQVAKSNDIIDDRHACAAPYAFVTTGARGTRGRALNAGIAGDCFLVLTRVDVLDPVTRHLTAGTVYQRFQQLAGLSHARVARPHFIRLQQNGVVKVVRKASLRGARAPPLPRASSNRELTAQRNRSRAGVASNPRRARSNGSSTVGCPHRRSAFSWTSR